MTMVTTVVLTNANIVAMVTTVFVVMAAATSVRE